MKEVEVENFLKVRMNNSRPRIESFGR